MDLHSGHSKMIQESGPDGHSQVGHVASIFHEVPEMSHAVYKTRVC